MYRFNLAGRAPARLAALATLVALATATAAQATTARPLRAMTRLGMTAVQAPNAVADSALTFTRIDDPADPTFNQLLGIDNAGVISGYFGSSAKGHPNQGYTVAGPHYNDFVSDNLPTSTQTQATGITPNATTSGFWAPTNLGPNLDQNYGFIRVVSGNGQILWLSVNDPLTAGKPKVNQVLGVNASLNAVGFYNDKNNNTQGFAYSVSTGKFSHPFIDASAVSSAITGLNNANTICGFFTDNKAHTKGFIQLNNGSNVHFLVPGSTTTQFFGVNAANEAVGDYLDGNNVPHGIVYNFATKVLTIVNDPSGAMGTTLNGINDKHQAVGFYTDAAGNTHGLLVGNIP